jgi:hypothetical protein
MVQDWGKCKQCAILTAIPERRPNKWRRRWKYVVDHAVQKVWSDSGLREWRGGQMTLLKWWKGGSDRSEFWSKFLPRPVNILTSFLCSNYGIILPSLTIYYSLLSVYWSTLNKLQLRFSSATYLGISVFFFTICRHFAPKAYYSGTGTCTSIYPVGMHSAGCSHLFNVLTMDSCVYIVVGRSISLLPFLAHFYDPTVLPTLQTDAFYSIFYIQKISCQHNFITMKNK